MTELNLRAAIGNKCNRRINDELEKQKRIGACSPKWIDKQVKWMKVETQGMVFDNALREYLVQYILREVGVIAFGIENGKVKD